MRKVGEYYLNEEDSDVRKDSTYIVFTRKEEFKKNTKRPIKKSIINHGNWLDLFISSYIVFVF